MKKVILVDGNNLLFRSYYATSYSGVIMRNSKGFPTNALYGFINMMNKIINEEKPSYILVAFDKGKTFRHDKYTSYKAGRKEMPDELKLQFPKAKEVLDAMGIKHFEIDNYEADDIIGTVSKIVDNEDKFIATIISSDKDLLQLITNEVDVKLLKQHDFIRMNEQTFFDTYKIEPIKMIDLKALMGDASDNIPGVKGIGEKTAIKLLSEYKSLDNLYNNVDNLSSSIKDKLITYKSDAYMSYDIATIYKDVKLDFTLEDLYYKGLNKDEYIKILQELEFFSILKKLDVKENTEESLIIKDIKAFQNKDFSYYIEIDNDNYSKANIIGIGIYDGVNGYYIEKNIDLYKDLFINNNTYTYDLKKNIVLLNKYNIKLTNKTEDLMIALYLLDYENLNDLNNVAQALGYNLIDSNEEINRKAILKAKFIYEIKNKIITKLNDYNVYSLYKDIEMPLVYILADMELTGIKVDRKYLETVEKDLEEKIKIKEAKIYELVGCEFNILSPKQLGEILFVKLQIPYPKKIKNNSYSTSKDILDKIVDKHEVVSEILDYRTLNKLYSNYAKGLISEIREDGRIHTIYTQTLTKTGRLSSINPNLQNIPSSILYSKLIRSAFVKDNEDSLLMSSDYSQIELRVFAHISNSLDFINAFNNNEDIHTTTASIIYNIDKDSVTKDQRKSAKAINFGILYGMSSFGLAEDLGISVKDAKVFIDRYLDKYKAIKVYMEEEVKKAYEVGYVETIMHRRRVIKELNSSNYIIRSAGERMALNTPIQGSAADILKKAMVDIYQEFKNRNLKSKMLLQVHDEVVFNVLKSEEEEVKEIVKDKMENVIKLKLPLKVDIEVGNNWYEAK